MSNVNVKDISLFGQNRSVDRIPSLSSGLMSTYGWLNWEPGPGEHISDMAGKTVALLIEQFRVDRPLITALVKSVGDACQDIEEVLFDLIRFRSVGQATGKQLDEIGNIVGISRTDPNDDIYRSDIYFQIDLNHSNGEPETLISALQRVLHALTVDYCENYPCKVILTANQFTEAMPAKVYSKMKALCVGGVDIDIQYSNATDIFIFNGDILGDSPISPYYILENDPYFLGLGFSEIVDGDLDNPQGGGSFVELIYKGV